MNKRPRVSRSKTYRLLPCLLWYVRPTFALGARYQREPPALPENAPFERSMSWLYEPRLCASMTSMSNRSRPRRPGTPIMYTCPFAAFAARAVRCDGEGNMSPHLRSRKSYQHGRPRRPEPAPCWQVVIPALRVACTAVLVRFPAQMGSCCLLRRISRRARRVWRT